LATLLVDLLSEAEDTDYQARFDLPLLAERLDTITDWVTHDERTEHLSIGYFGASTGAAAAMIAAEGAEDTVKAVVSRGGRVDLAHGTAEVLKVPTLFIVGQEDYGVREANEEVFLKLKCKKELAVIPKATHLFEEPGALERVAELAAQWFKEYLRS
jgi:putative phosphoribosyl transferase